MEYENEMTELEKLFAFALNREKPQDPPSPMPKVEPSSTAQSEPEQQESDAMTELEKLFDFSREPERSRVEPSSTPTFVPPANNDTLTDLPFHLLLDYPKEKDPFRPYSPEALEALREDIRINGVLQPAVVRPHPTRPGYYEIISGHHRKAAAMDLGYTTMPVIVRKMDDDTAIRQMISTNLKQRSELLPSEKAWAYRYQMEAMKRQGLRTDLTSDFLDDAEGQKPSDSAVFGTSSQVGTKLRTDELLAQSSSDSRNQIQRYIRLTYLIPEIIQMVDNKKLGLTVGVTLSYLTEENQRTVKEFFLEQHSILFSQAVADRLREMERSGKLDQEELERAFLTPPTVKEIRSVNIKLKKWRKYFDDSATEKDVLDTIEKALKAYFSSRE